MASAMCISMEAVSCRQESRYALLEALLGQGMDIVCGFETWVVVDVLASLQKGLATALRHKILIQCAKAIDFFGSFLFRHKHRDTPVVSRMRHHLTQVPTLVTELIALLVKQLLTDDHTDLGILSHPLLSLILADESSFKAFSQAFVARQQPHHQQTAAEALADLMTGVDRNLDIPTRRRFLSKIQAFRTKLSPWEELALH
mmetsp:Transcript_21831/g.53121  ORF Transcript_21831/g.53121 Transcript_21831/m.53121 type:complete len:201 (-) Transcript_21831:50-652(-)